MIYDVRVGDKLKAIGFDISLGDYEVGDIIEVVANSDFDSYLVEGKIEIAALTSSVFGDKNKKLFTAVPKDLPRSIDDVKIGDAVRVTRCNTLFTGDLKVGDTLKVVTDKGDCRPYIEDGCIEIAALTTSAFADVYMGLFELATNEYEHNLSTPQWEIHRDGNLRLRGEGLGVARPDLETRKIGKDQMHMVNDGFPLALRHLSQIMTWAEEVKQYKLHDWRNLPNAETEFPSAEYRHANDNSIQKAEGLSALERVDHESGKLHIGHKVFNALCELELVLRGDIK